MVGDVVGWVMWWSGGVVWWCGMVVGWCCGVGWCDDV